MLGEWAGRAGALYRRTFTDREFYMRSHGEVRFVRLSARAQKVAAMVLLALFAAWASLSGNVIWSQYNLSNERSQIAGAMTRLSSAAESARSNRRAADARADELEARQQVLEALASDYFGIETEQLTTEGAAPESASSPVTRIESVERRQTSLVADIEKVANARAEEAELAVRKLGLNPDRLAKASGQGGPFVPFAKGEPDADLVRLGEALGRLDQAERALLAVPSFTPADGGRLSSRFGFRRDPFSGRAALHQGQDFRGRPGSAIRAAAAGKIVRAGWWAGYGRAVEIDHGGGLRTRYGHMSKLDVKVGQRIARGDRIGAMGSTGRSTGTHLHFEVRVDGRAVNPRPFLEASDHVLKIQDIARRRIADGGKNG